MTSFRLAAYLLIGACRINEGHGHGGLIPIPAKEGALANRELWGECPPGLSNGICRLDRLQSPSGYEACATECIEAQCCQPEDGQPSCMFTCGLKCFSYMDCMNLFEVEAPAYPANETPEPTQRPTKKPAKTPTNMPTERPTKSSSTPVMTPSGDEMANPAPSNGSAFLSRETTTPPTSSFSSESISVAVDTPVDLGLQQQCPPGLPPGICDANKLQDPSGYDACATLCMAAMCCQPEDGQESCMSTCGGQCMLYMDCMNLSNVEAPPDDSQLAADTPADLGLQQQCPPGLPPGICDANKLQDPSGYDACATECMAAMCCQPEDGQESCMSTCGGQCMLYMDCMNLLDLEAPPDGALTEGTAHASSSSSSSSSNTSLSKSDTLSVDYYEGFNLNFIIDQSDAEKLMPYAQFTPLKLAGTHIKEHEDKANINQRGLRGESTEKTSALPSAEGYYISLYAAKIGVEINGELHRVGRADIFTYTIDPNGRPSLLIVGCYMEIPKMLQVLGDAGLQHYTQIITDLAQDSRTGKEAYPHYLAEVFDVSEDGVIISGGDVEESIVIDVKDCVEEGSSAKFTRQFVNANSIAWRSPIDKNINFFNQDFIDAPVRAFTADDSCMADQQIGHLHKQLPSSAKLENIEAYGSSDEAVVWKYDDLTESEGTPFLTNDEKQKAISFKRRVYSDMLLSRSTAIENGEAESLISLVQGENSVFIIWELSLEAVAVLADQFNLAEQGIAIVPIKVAEEGVARHIIALNVYDSEIEGDLNGKAVRYEWSTFVSKNQDSMTPYYMVIQAGSSTDTFDPVSGKEKATDVSLSRDGDVVALVVNTLTATLHLGTESLTIDREYTFANGKVYWSNGVFDAVYFDSSLVLAKPKMSTKHIIDMAEDFEWAALIGYKDPIYSFVYEDANTYLVSPWCNMKETNPLYAETKLPTFGGMAKWSSSQVKSGQREPSVLITVYGNHPVLPRLNINYEIPATSIEEFTRFLNLAPGLSLAPMRFTDKSSSVYTLTLALFHEALTLDQRPPWNKFVWSTYVKDESGKVYLNEFHVLMTGIELDIEDGFKLPVENFNISQTDDKIIEIAIQEGAVDLNIEVPQVGPTDNLIGLSNEWIDAHDRVYWKKGVYDKLYFNDQLSGAMISPIDAGQLNIVQKTPWLHLVEDEPFEAFYFLDDVSFVSIPWENIEEVL